MSKKHKDGLPAPTPQPNQPLPFSLQALGWACVASAGVLTFVAAWMSFAVINMLTQPILSEHTKTSKLPVISNVGSTPGKSGGVDIAPTMEVTLEYESMAIRTQGIQVTYGFVFGIIFLAAGLLLFAIASVSYVRLAAHLKPLHASLLTAAPGLVPIIISGCLIGLAINKDVRKKFDVAYQPNSGRIGTETFSVPQADHESKPGDSTATQAKDKNPHK